MTRSSQRPQKPAPYRHNQATRAAFRETLVLLASTLLVTACTRDKSLSKRSEPIPPGAIVVDTAASSNPPAPAPLGLDPAAPASSVNMPHGSPAPLSFSSLVKASDPGVVTVFSIVEDKRLMGRRRRIMAGLGTGFLYEPSGFILTNNHVVAEATDISVQLADGRRTAAKLIGRDSPTDVAVLKVDITGLPTLPLGDSNAMDVGDWVVAIGNPFGLSHTVSAGIVSAKGRTQADLGDLDKTGRAYFNFLQTDAAINQGNSGGPLLNLKGEVVGINTAIRANANNIGFAIPINMVKSLLPMLVREGKVTRSALGIGVDVIDEAEHRATRKGALVRSVQRGGPAEKSGIVPDDIIVAFNNAPVADPNELRWLASIAGVGTTATVRVSRGDHLFDVRVVLGALPDIPDEDGPQPLPPQQPGPGPRGAPPNFPSWP